MSSLKFRDRLVWRAIYQLLMESTSFARPMWTSRNIDFGSRSREGAAPTAKILFAVVQRWHRASDSDLRRDPTRDVSVLDVLLA